MKKFNWHKVIASFILLVMLVGILSIFAPFGVGINQAQADTNLAIQPCTIDTHIYKGSVNSNYGTADELDVMGGTSTTLTTLLQFNISSISAGANITGANFTMDYWSYSSANPSGANFTVFRLLRTDWVETQATWNLYKTGSNWTTAGCLSNGNDYTTTHASNVTMPANFGLVTWNITDIVQDCINASISTLNLVVACTSGTGYIGIFRSSEYATSANTPKMSINYTLPSPTVTTQAASSVEETTATGNGNITVIGGSTPTVRGICYSSTNATPTTADSKVQETGSFGTGAFTESLTGLTQGVLYYARAFATNTQGTGYGAVVTFLTKPLAPTSATATTIGEEEIDLTWVKGTGSDNTTVVAKKSSAPTNRTDGTIIYNGTGTSYNHTGLSGGEHWYYIFYSTAIDGATIQYNDAPDASADTWTVTPPTVNNLGFVGYGSDYIIVSGEITNIGDAPVTLVGIDYGITEAYGTSANQSFSLTSNTTTEFVITVRGLSAGNHYNFRVKAYNGVWGYSGDDSVSTIGSPVLSENVTDATADNSTAIYGINYLSQSFITTEAHTVTNIYIAINKVGTPSGYVTIELKHADDNDLPTGLALASSTLACSSVTTTFQWFDFAVDETYLEYDTVYCIVISAISGDNSSYIQWKSVTVAITDYTSGSSNDSGITWADTSDIQHQFQIWGNSVMSILNVNAFTGYNEDEDLLVTVEYNNKYPPYYTSAVSPKNYFVVELLGTDGTTVLAASPMPSWGNKIGSIYLSASSASSITVGGAYYVRIYGTFTGNPYTAYQLTGSDWKGTNKNNIDDWVISTAYNLETLNSATYIETSAGVDYLNNLGGQIYEAGISLIRQIRPNLFFYNLDGTTNTLTATETNAYDATAWTTMVGTQIAEEFNTFGDLISVSGQSIGVIIALLAVAIFGIIAAKGNGTAIGGIVIGALFLIGATVFHFIGIGWILGITTLLFFIALMMFLSKFA